MEHNIEMYATVPPPVCLISKMKTKYTTWNYTYRVIPYNMLHLR